MNFRTQEFIFAFRNSLIVFRGLIFVPGSHLSISGAHFSCPRIHIRNQDLISHPGAYFRAQEFSFFIQEFILRSSLFSCQGASPGASRHSPNHSSDTRLHTRPDKYSTDTRLDNPAAAWRVGPASSTAYVTLPGRNSGNFRGIFQKFLGNVRKSRGFVLSKIRWKSIEIPRCSEHLGISDHFR